MMHKIISKRKKLIISCLVALSLVVPNLSHARSAFDDPIARTSGGSLSTGVGLVSVENDVDGGNISIGSSASIVTLFRNEGVRSVKVNKINLYPSSTVSSYIALNQCAKAPLEPMAECAVVIAVKGLQEGAWRVEMLMGHNGKTKLVTSTITGNVEADGNGEDSLSSDIELIPSELDFETLTSSQTLIKSVIFRNITSETIDIKNIGVMAGKLAGYSVTSDCARIKTGESCIATVKWSPKMKGATEGFMLIEHTGPSRIASINLKGKFSPESTEQADIFPEVVPGEGLIVSSESDIDFGTDIENMSAITISLVNVGDQNVNIDDIALSGTDNGLSLLRKGCLVTKFIEPNSACPLTINWAPPREGSIIDDIQINHDGTRGVLIIPVRGTALKAVSKDSKAIIEKDGVLVDLFDKTEVLDGFVVTSHSSNKSIIAGPGGSRVVRHGQEAIMGGVVWDIKIIKSGVEFLNGKDKIILLFDKSLSSSDRYTVSSGSSSSSASSTSEGN